MGSRYGCLLLHKDLQAAPTEALRALGLKLDSSASAPVRRGPLPLKGDAGEVGVAFANGWTIIYGDTFLGLADEHVIQERLPELSAGTRAVWWGTEGVSGFLGLEVWEDGIRLRAYEEVCGETKVLLGEPPPRDNKYGEIDEWQVVAAAAREAIPWDLIARAEFDYYRTGRPL